MFNYEYLWGNDDQTILYCRLDLDEWTWDDALKVVTEQVNWMQSVDHTEKIHTIFHFRKRPPLPKVHSIRKNLIELMQLRAPNEGLSIFINYPVQFSLLMQGISQTVGLGWLTSHYRFVDTLAEAYSACTQFDAECASPVEASADDDSR